MPASRKRLALLSLSLAAAPIGISPAIGGPADAVSEPVTSTVRFESTGRSVEVRVRDQGVLQKCSTPCEMRLPPGVYHARVDGLDREVSVGGNVVVIRPTRNRMLALGIAAAVVGCTGLTFAGHWASPLEGRDRVVAGLGGAALMVLAAPLIRWSSARLDDGSPGEQRVIETPERIVAALGLAHPVGSDLDSTALTAAIGYRLASSRLTIETHGQYAGLADNQAVELTAGPSFHIARLPIISVRAGLRLGLETRRGEKAGAVRPGEINALGELVSEIRLEVPAPIVPALNVRYQLVHRESWQHRVVAGAGLVMAF